MRQPLLTAATAAVLAFASTLPAQDPPPTMLATPHYLFVLRGDGNFAGSWDPVGVWDETGGRVFATALDALSLEASARAGKKK